MPKDVLITPASSKIEFKDNSSNIDGIIQLDASDNLSITSPNGILNIGSASGHVYIGDGVTVTDLIFDQSGTIKAATGKTLTIGATGSNVILTGTLSTSSTNLITNLNADLLDGQQGSYYAPIASPTFTGIIGIPGTGTNQIKAGTGDGASFTTYNMRIRSWWGIGFTDYQDLTTATVYIDTRAGKIGASGTPTSSEHLTTKAYVDSVAGSGGGIDAFFLSGM